MARQILNTLYVMTPHSYLHRENDTLRVNVEHEKKMQVPLHHLGSVVSGQYHAFPCAAKQVIPLSH